MRARILLFVVVLLAGGFAVADPVTAGPSAERPGRVCYTQGDGDIAGDVVSQNFEQAFDTYDSQAADDLRVDRRCRARVVWVWGDSGSATGEAHSQTVIFYRDRQGTPGRQIRSETLLGVHEDWGWRMTLERRVRLRPSRVYWVSVILNQDFQLGGRWRWWTTPDEPAGAPAMWRNPSDGFGVGCVDWTVVTDCDPNAGAAALSFDVSTR